ncbi:transposase-like protein [Paraburkholderia silvatlantica]|uniref:Transposase-like protein n=1 Tax=Paraburkholderia silvatlantica TaxID=321895 RepID=A0ABR6G0N9_9BURK|nr:transposase-like protein [Paraburkholderia silvatlantica]
MLAHFRHLLLKRIGVRFSGSISHAVDPEGNTVDFLLRAHRDKAAARRYFEKAIAQNCVPETVTIDKRGANLAAFKDIKVVNQIIGYVYFVYRY